LGPGRGFRNPPRHAGSRRRGPGRESSSGAGWHPASYDHRLTATPSAKSHNEGLNATNQEKGNEQSSQGDQECRHVVLAPPRASTLLSRPARLGMVRPRAGGVTRVSTYRTSLCPYGLSVLPDQLTVWPATISRIPFRSGLPHLRLRQQDPADPATLRRRQQSRRRASSAKGSGSYSSTDGCLTFLKRCRAARRLASYTISDRRSPRPGTAAAGRAEAPGPLPAPALVRIIDHVYDVLTHESLMS